MRAIFLIGINFVRTQWVAVAVMSAYVIGIGSIYRLHTQREDVLFFLRWHAGYAIFLAVMMAIPALQVERKSRRILAVLSKGIHRWQYLGGILWGCAIISGIFCLLIGVTAATLARQGGVEINGLAGAMTVLFFCCILSAAVGLFFSVFLHPLLATAAASTVLSLPFLLDQAGLQPPWKLFPVAAFFHIAERNSGFQLLGDAMPALGLIAALQALIFWIAASAIFGRRDVTISPE
jgi:hypothetical protein